MARKTTVILLAAVLLLLTIGCAPGNERWAPDAGKANFWAGLWHGLIIIITFVVSWFTNDVGIYEPHNVGFGYNIGFILGVMISLGGGVKGTIRRKRKAKVVYRKPDWERLGQRIGRGVQEGVKAACEGEARTTDADWEELGKRIEERIKREFEDWDKEE